MNLDWALLIDLFSYFLRAEFLFNCLILGLWVVVFLLLLLLYFFLNWTQLIFFPLKIDSLLFWFTRILCHGFRKSNHRFLEGLKSGVWKLVTFKVCFFNALYYFLQEGLGCEIWALNAHWPSWFYRLNVLPIIWPHRGNQS